MKKKTLKSLSAGCALMMVLLTSCGNNAVNETTNQAAQTEAVTEVATEAATTVKAEPSEAVKVLNERAEKYLAEMKASGKDITTETDADWYSLNNGALITEFIPSFKRTDMTLFEIQGGELCYVGPEVEDPENLICKVSSPLSGGLSGKDHPEYYEAVLSEAYDYYYQGNEMYYDMYSVRRNTNCLPNDATSDRTRYMDCSGYVFTIYYNTLLETGGKNMYIGDAPTQNGYINEISAGYNDPKKPQYVCYFARSSKDENIWNGGVREDAKDFTGDEMLEALKKAFQPGDVLVIRRGTITADNGHALIYVGDGNFLHSTGYSLGKKASPDDVMGYTTLYSDNSSKYADTPVTGEMDHGTIYKTHCEYFFDRDKLIRDYGNPEINCRYLLYDGKMFGDDRDNMNYCVQELGIIRPLAMDTIEGLTEEGTGALNYPEITAEKQILKDGVSTYERTVKPGDTLTLSIKLENHGKETVEGIPVADGDLISETVSLSPAGTDGAVKFVTAEFKVPDDAGCGSVLSPRASVGGISTNEFIYVIGNKDTEEKKAALLPVLETELPYEGTVLDAAKLLYKTAFEKDILEGFDAENIVKLYPDKNSNSVFSEELPVIPTLLGGYSVHANADLKLNGVDYVRRVRPEYLEAGDLIVIGKGSSKLSLKEIYLFVDSENIYAFNETDDGIRLEAVYTDEKTVTSFLTSLYCTRGFMILRP